MKTKISKFVTILYFGAIWGILEASLGYVLHLVPALIAGTIMFPVAAVILYRGYQATNSKSSLVGIGAIAVIIKSVNFLMPSYSIWKIINPMISIMVESLLVIAVISLMNKDSLTSKIVALPLASIAWRGVFLGMLAVEYLFNGFLANQISSFSAILNFALYYGLFSGLLATGFYFISELSHKIIGFNFKKSPAISFCLFAIVIVLTILL